MSTDYLDIFEALDDEHAAKVAINDLYAPSDQR
jgi:hypothetical protein